MAADLEYIIKSENRRLLEAELEKARREVARKVCRSFVPLMALPESQRNTVLLALGLEPGILKEEEYRSIELPTRAAGRWKVTVRAYKDEDDWEPDKEVVDVMEEEINRGIDRNSTDDRMLEVGLVQKGQKITIIYGSSGGGD
ncbi:MAG: hypothetical protein ACPLSY_03745 [Moorellaceae bacterium]